MAFVAIAPFMYMQDFKLSIMAYTLHQGVMIAAFAITSAFFGVISHKLGMINTMRLGLISLLSGSIALPFVSSPYLLTFVLSVYSIGAALQYPIVFAQSFEIFPECKGSASSVIMSLRALLCAAITGVASTVYDGQPMMLGIVILVVTATTVLILPVSLWMLKHEGR